MLDHHLVKCYLFYANGALQINKIICIKSSHFGNVHKKGSCLFMRMNNVLRPSGPRASGY